jgi:hypothetical protein
VSDFIVDHSGERTVTHHAGCGQEVISETGPDHWGWICECGAVWDASGVRTDDTIALKDVARLDLKPGDTLVVTLPANATAQQGHETRERILGLLGGRLAGDHLLVILEHAKLSVLRQTDEATS